MPSYGNRFKRMGRLTREQVAAAVDALHADQAFAVRVDLSNVFVVFVSSAGRGLPYELDFIATATDMRRTTTTDTIEPVAMTLREQQRLQAWAAPTVKLLIEAWRERHPEA